MGDTRTTSEKIQEDRFSTLYGFTGFPLEVEVGYLESRINDLASIVSRLLEGVTRAKKP